MFDIVQKEFGGKSIQHLLYHILAEILSLKNYLKMTNEDLVAALQGLATEVGTVADNVAKLDAAIAGEPADSVPQPVQDAFNALKTSLDSLVTASQVPGATTAPVSTGS